MAQQCHNLRKLSRNIKIIYRLSDEFILCAGKNYEKHFKFSFLLLCTYKGRHREPNVKIFRSQRPLIYFIWKNKLKHSDKATDKLC